MSALSAEKVRHPQEMSLPPLEMVLELLRTLPEGRGREFASELVKALEDARTDGNLAHVEHVIEGWYRTFLTEKGPDFDKRWKIAREAAEAKAPGMDLDEVRKRLRLE